MSDMQAREEGPFNGSHQPTERSADRASLDLKVRYQNVEALEPYGGNARTHSDKQIAQIAASIGKFGFNNPVLVDGDNRIVAGHGRVEAAKRLGLENVPTIRLDHLSDAERRFARPEDPRDVGHGDLGQGPAPLKGHPIRRLPDDDGRAAEAIEAVGEPRDPLGQVTADGVFGNIS